MFRKLSFLFSCVLVLCLVGNSWGVIANQDVGNTGLAGSASEAAGVWTIEGSGRDLWDADDGFHYVYRPMEGNGIMKVNLASMAATETWAKVGVMIRESLTNDSKHATMAMTGSKGCQLVYRTDTGGGSADITTGGQIPPKEMWIERDSDTFRGTFWNWIIQDLLGEWQTVETTISMDTDVYIGMAVCSHNNGLLCTAVFDSVIWPGPYYKPWLLSPEDGVMRLPLQPTLTWMPGDSATSHDVYLGTNPIPTDEAPVATKALGDESYTPDTPLAEGTVYYWQIVEQPGDYASAVMSFKTERSGTGMIDYQLWFDIGGGAVTDLTGNPRYPDDPSVTGTITVLDSGTDLGDNYGGRAIGFLAPETSGDYTFWIASDDDSELWLSTSAKGCEAVMISSVAGWTGYHAYDWQDSQKSVPIYLEGGQMYPIWALWKEGGGGDHCSVAWEGPDSPSRTEIDGYFLMPGYVNLWASNQSPTGTVTPLEADTLSFKPASGATEHQVLFGEAGSMALIDTLPAEVTSVAVSVEVGKTYEWQVNEVFGTDVAEGCPWSFSVVEWANKDIGTTGGSASYDEATDTWTITGDGADIWDSSDHFHYVYKKVKCNRGEGELIALVKSFPLGPNAWQKTGVMMRESLAANSKWIDQVITGGNGGGESFQWRDNTGGGCGGSHTHSGVAVPEWVKLVRVGNNYTGFHAEDIGGAPGEWQQEGGTHYHEQPELTYIGIAFTSHQEGTLITGQISNFSFTTKDMRQSYGPSPMDGADWQSIHTTVAWGAGDDIALHRVHFSNDEAAVMARTALVAELPADVTECDPIGSPRDSLMLTETYYWVVDEVMPDGTVIPGEIWSFTVEPYRLVDDFESYDVGPEPLPEQQLVPGDIVVEAVPPPDNAWIEPVTLVEAVAPDEGCLVSRWEFDGDYTDSANGNDGTPQGDATIVTDGERGQVLSLDGDADYVDCGNPVNLDFGTGDWSVCAWINTTVTGKPKGVIYAKGGDDGGGHRYTIGVGESKSDRVTLTTDDNADKKQAHTSTHVTDGVWHHVIGVREGDTIKIYTDGKLEGSSGVPAGYDLSGTSQREALIGAIWEHGKDYIDKWYTGMIDDVRVYNCALTEGNARYMSGLGSLVKPGYYGPLVARYAFDEGSGDTAIDSSGNDLDGVISGAVYTATTADGSASCLDFSGAGDNVLNLDAGPYLNNLDALSISLWIQSDLTNTDKGFIMGHDPGSDRYGMRYDKAGGSGGGTPNVIKYGVCTTGGNEEDESAEGLQTTEWQHLVMSWQSGVGMKLYVNGVLTGPSFDAGPVSGVLTGYDKLLVGKGSKDGDADAGWDGRIDDVRVYACALSEGEARYLAGIGNKTLPDRFVPMLGHYQFEGDYTDSTDNHFDGTPLGDVNIVDDPGVASFDGDGDAVDIGNSELFNFTDDFSISVWVNLNSWGGNWSNVIVGKRGEGGVGWQLRRFGGDQRFSWTTRGMGNDDYPVSYQDISMGKWYHLAAIRDGTQKRLYINGVLESTQGINSNPVNACSHNVYIGARANGDNSGPESFFDGKVDELRIYNTALTLGQIRELADYVPTNSIGDTWSGRGAVSPKLDYNIAHEGSQSMRVEYTGDGAVKRLEPFGDGADPHEWSGDWTLGDSKALAIYFRGDPENAPGQMFAQLTTTVPSAHTQRVVYDGDPEDLLIPEWQEWNIELHELYTGKPFDPPLPDEGLPATKIKEVGVGILGGSGVLYFDDLRVYPTRCVPKYGPYADITDDCIVDIDDVRALVGDWLDGDKTGTGLVARYEFDGDLTDSSGNGHDGTAHGAVGFETDAVRGQVLSLPGGDDQFVSIPPVGISGNDPTTIACWAKADHTSIPDWTLVFGFTTPGGNCGSHFNIGSIGGPGGVGAHVWCWEATIFTDDEALEWRHYAMTFDGSTMSYYGDGMLIGTLDYDFWRRGDYVHIGSRITQASSFPGKVDDARIYDRELSTAEVNTVMSGAEVEPVYTPLMSAANLYDEEPVNSKKINFKDYAVLMQEWLTEKLWP